MKKFLSLFLSISLLMVLVGCNGGPKDPPAQVNEQEGVTVTEYLDGVLFKWAAVDGAEGYVVRDGASGTEVFVEKPEYFAHRELKRSKIIGSTWTVIYVKAKNAAGTSEEARFEGNQLELEDYHLKSSDNYLKGATFTTVTVELPKDDKMPVYSTYHYTAQEAHNDDALTYKSEDNANTVTIEGLDPADYESISVSLVVTWLDENGVEKESDEYVGSIYVETKDFPAVKNIRAESKTRKSVSVIFDPLTQEDVEGLDITKMGYEVYCYDSDNSYIRNRKVEDVTKGTEIPLLDAGTEYNFKVFPKYDNRSAIAGKGGDPVTISTYGLFSAPKNIVVTEITGVADAPYTQINVKWDPCESQVEGEKLQYNVGYRVLQTNYYTKYYYIYKDYSADGFTFEEVNGGNKISVVVYAKADDGTEVISEPVVKQLNEVDDFNVYKGLYDASGVILHASTENIHCDSGKYNVDARPFNSKPGMCGSYKYILDESFFTATSKAGLVVLNHSSASSYDGKVKLDGEDCQLAYTLNLEIIEPVYTYNKVVDLKPMSSIDYKGNGQFTPPSNLSFDGFNTIKDEYIFNNSLYMYVKYSTTEDANDTTYVLFSFYAN